MIRIRKPGKPLAGEKLAEVESRFGFTFPSYYRAFLLEHNGGTPELDTVRLKGAKRADETFEFFHGIDTGSTGDDLIEAFENYKDSEDPRIPDRLVPIGADSFGNLYCISTKGDDTGAVYLWNHEEEGAQTRDSNIGVGDEALSYVADSFKEFLTQFGDAPEKRRKKRLPEWVELIQAGDIEGFRAWLDAGGDPLALDKERWETPVGLAVAEKRTEMVLLMLDRGVHPRLVVDDAVRHDAWELAIIGLARLKGRGWQPTRFMFGRALENCRDVRVIQAFVDAGADLNKPLDGGNALYHATGRFCEPEIVRFLLDRGAKVGEFFHGGMSALTRAILNGNLEVCKMLIDAGGQLYAQPPFEKDFHYRMTQILGLFSKRERAALEHLHSKSAAWYLDNDDKGKRIRDEVIAYAAARGQKP